MKDLPRTAIDCEEESFRWYAYATLCVGAALIIFSREPGAFLHPQFFAEDGHVWFADAFNHGWLAPLVKAQNGYLHTVPRLAAGLSLLFPLRYAPLVTNSVGLAFQIIPVLLLFSKLLSRWGTFLQRGVLALIYLVMPNCREINVTVTAVQWHLALIACMLLLAGKPRSRVGRVCALATFVLFGLTGPFVVVLIPVAGVYLWFQRERWLVWITAILIATATIQAWVFLVIDRGARGRLPLGASVSWLIRIFGGQIVFSTVAGANVAAVRAGLSFLVCAAGIGLLLLVWGLAAFPLERKLFLVFSLMVFAVSLASPLVNFVPAASTVWQTIAAAPAIHYWFFPTLALAWTIAWFCFEPTCAQAVRILAIGLLCLMPIGVVRDWRYPPYKDLHFEYYAAEVARSRPGTVLVIPENPDGWQMELVKR